MERQLLTWSIPNMITVWFMLLAMFLAFTVIAQVIGGFKSRGGVETAAQAEGY